MCGPLTSPAGLVNDVPDRWRIGREQSNIVIWQRGVSAELQRFVGETLLSRELKRAISCHSSAPDLTGLLAGIPETEGQRAFCEDVRLQIAVYAAIWGPGKINLKLECFAGNLCERFHTDWVGLRLICSYAGPGTEWLRNEDVDRSRLGPGSGGLPDEESGLIRPGAAVQRLERFAVALMKGEKWPGNRGNALVHRSPRITDSGQRRVLFKIDSDEVPIPEVSVVMAAKREGETPAEP